MINTFSNLIEERNSIKKYNCGFVRVSKYVLGGGERDSLYSVATISSLYDAE